MSDISDRVIYGLHLGHNSSCCVAVNGKVLAAAEEERFNRKKNFNGFPRNAYNFCKSHVSSSCQPYYCLTFSKNEGLKEWFPSVAITLRKFGHTGIGWNYFTKLELLSRLIFINIYPRRIIYKLLIILLRREGVDTDRLYFFNHHLCHAASAFYVAPFVSDFVLVLDGKGDGSSGGLYKYISGKLTEVANFPARASIGQPYSAVTKFLGFIMNRHEGKITGLAAHGKSSRFRHIFDNMYPEDSIGSFPAPSFFRKEITFASLIRQWSSLIRRDISKLSTLLLSNSLELKAFAVQYDCWIDKFRSSLGDYDFQSKADLAASVQ